MGAAFLAGLAVGFWQDTDELKKIFKIGKRFPMYAAGVHADGKLAVVIVLAKAQPDQMNLYFQNLFTIIQNTLIIQSYLNRQIL